MEIQEKFDFAEEIEKTKRLGNCEVCDLNSAKYTCPKCEIKTCCLNCQKIHKKELECDGIRDRTKYKPLKQMTSMDFMNDYYFLEETTRFVKEKQNNKLVKHSKKLHMRFQKLKKEALIRKIRLFFVTDELTKRKKNQSHFKAAEQIIYWYCELIFPNANNFKISKKWSENLKIQDILKSLFEVSDENEKCSKELDYYRAHGLSNLKVLLKAEGLKSCSNRYYEMNIKKSLRANLEGKTLIEYPTIIVLMSQCEGDYDLVDSDDENLGSELNEFRKLLHEEVFSKKTGINPPLIKNPEELPLMAELPLENDEVVAVPVINPVQNQPQTTKPCQPSAHIECDDDEMEVRPENYLFSEL
ncbi:unnamed protein product [Diamesa tonsa]